MADRCEELSADLTAGVTQDVPGGLFQPTTGAVRTVNLMIVSTAQILATRMSATAEKLATSAAGYATQDQDNASTIEAVKF